MRTGHCSTGAQSRSELVLKAQSQARASSASSMSTRGVPPTARALPVAPCVTVAAGDAHRRAECLLLALLSAAAEDPVRPCAGAGEPVASLLGGVGQGQELARDVTGRLGGGVP
jgi:hypothetical protein